MDCDAQHGNEYVNKTCEKINEMQPRRTLEWGKQYSSTESV